MELFTYLVVTLAPLTVYRQRCKSNLSGQLLIQDNTKSLRKTGGCQQDLIKLDRGLRAKRIYLKKREYRRKLWLEKVYYIPKAMSG